LIKAPVLEQTVEIFTDGTPTKALAPDGTQSVVVTRWSEDGQSLISTSTDSANGQPAEMKMTRTLAPDRRSMYVDMEFTYAGGEPVRVRRIFRLIALPAEEAVP
jgi:hypothetical protein